MLFSKKDFKESILKFTDQAMEIDAAKATCFLLDLLAKETKETIRQQADEEMKFSQRKELSARLVDIGHGASQAANVPNQGDDVSPYNKEEDTKELDLCTSQDDLLETSAQSSHGTSPSKEGKDEHTSPGQQEPTAFEEVTE